MDVADLIIGGLSGQHLHGFLPGSDNRAAISRAVRSKHGWSGPGMGWGQVAPDGIGEWPSLAGTSARIAGRHQDATLFVTWAEVLAVIARGCAGGYREAYETAYRAWCAAAAQAHDAYRAWVSAGAPLPRPAPGVMSADPGIMRSAAAALIRRGCELTEVQEALF